MTAPRHEPEFARADALAAVVREIDGLRRTVDPLRDIGGRLDDLGQLVGQLSDAVNAVSARPGPTPAPSWLLLPTDPAVADRVLGEVCGWLHAVFLRYPDGATALPECWLYHPDVVEELLWLMHAWCAAYQGKAASVQLAGDWHDRQRPGVVRRIRGNAGSCSIERHQTRDDWDQRPTGAVPVPGIGAAAAIAGWWARHRDDPAPEPARREGAPLTNGIAHR
ncbi:hypothetical protein [Pseudonocardia hydrocarbonoxydans]|uniref:DUF4913 domain-containing protein n=1 Tax=Pseudonocardia hydrocarbonoxydans TaxID=76726 RepID=A0A4Y3WVR9_9PSEU|nr:hypothetical protein [Pseudonocardia hydrocarbonoxydans]GEC22678.1 hypothetical protein PHY01_49610 [Pseudonocardia hydrocarbonoxydans]